MSQKFKVISPTRVDLAGGTLDLWPLYCLIGGGKTINMSLDLTASAQFEISPSNKFRVELKTHSGEAFFFESLPSSEDISKLGRSLQFPVAVITQYLANKSELPPRKIQIDIDSKAPVGSGLGGSSCLCVALTRGIARVFGDYIDQGWQWKMLEWVKDMEAAFLKTPTGTQDYLASLFGGLNCFISDVGGIQREPYPTGVFEELSERILVLYSGEMHQSGISNWQLFKGAMEGDSQILKGMREIARVADELDGELRAGNLNWKYVGRSLNEEWSLRKELFQVQTPRLDEIIEFLKTQDIYGAKVCGAAQGGSLLVVLPPSLRTSVAQECQRNGIQVLAAQGTPHGVAVVDL